MTLYGDSILQWDLDLFPFQNFALCISQQNICAAAVVRLSQSKVGKLHETAVISHFADEIVAPCRRQNARKPAQSTQPTTCGSDGPTRTTAEEGFSFCRCFAAAEPIKPAPTTQKSHSKFILRFAGQNWRRMTFPWCTGVSSGAFWPFEGQARKNTCRGHYFSRQICGTATTIKRCGVVTSRLYRSWRWRAVEGGLFVCLGLVLFFCLVSFPRCRQQRW